MRRVILQLISYSLIFLLHNSCTSPLKIRKGTSFFQNFTTQYNILYNSRLLLLEAEKNRVFTYTGIADSCNFPLFYHPTTESIAVNTSLAQDMIGKANKILEHKPNSDYVNWAYLLLMRANYEMGNYHLTTAYADYLVHAAEVNEPEVITEALINKTFAYFSLGYDQLLPSLLDTLLQTTRADSPWQATVYALHADYQVQHSNYQEALEMLVRAISLSKKKEERLRWQHINATLYQQLHKNEEAIALFKRLAKNRLHYPQLALMAEMRLLSFHYPTFDERIKHKHELLNRKEYDEHQPLIRLSLADEYEHQRDYASAAYYYQTILQPVTSTSADKAHVYTRLADLYFADEQFSRAGAMYDSLLNNNTPSTNYMAIQRKQLLINDIVKLKNVIDEEEHLQKWSFLPSEHQMEAIRQYLIEKPYHDQNQRNEESSVITQTDKMLLREKNTFYFNNPVAVATGKMAFQTRWGNREHHENWRWNKLNSVQATTSTTPAPLRADEAKPMETALTNEPSDAEIDRLLKAIPKTDQQKATSNANISRALFSLATIYARDFEQNTLAIATYDALLSKSPDLKENGYITRQIARLQKNELVPESDSLSRAERSDIMNDEYERAFELLKAGDYLRARQLTENILKKRDPEEDQSLFAQFAYLKALTVGYTAPLPIFERELQDVVKNYPYHPLLDDLIQHQLSYLREHRDALSMLPTALTPPNDEREAFEEAEAMMPWPALVFPERKVETYAGQKKHSGEKRMTEIEKISIKPSLTIESPTSETAVDESIPYFYVINVHSASVNLNPSRYGIGQFNRSKWKNKKISHQLVRIKDKKQLIYIGPFNNFAEVKTYEEQVTPLLETIMKIPNDRYDTSIIPIEQFDLLLERE